jgi:gentisate 1,2-dioxygenase
MSGQSPEVAELNAWMREHHLHGYWAQRGGGTGVQVKPYLWTRADVRAGLTKLEPRGPGEWRTLPLRNAEQRGVPSTMSLSAHVLLPGERAEIGRRFESQVYFVIEAPRGASITVDGESFPMESGDLIVAPLRYAAERQARDGRSETPSPPPGERVGVRGQTAFRNDGEVAAIWLAGTDLNLLKFIGAEIDEVDGTDRSYGELQRSFPPTRSRMVDPLAPQPLERPCVRHAWSDTVQSLVAFQRSEGSGDACDGIHLRYTSPVDGEATLSTLSCEVQLLPSEFHGRPHRHNSTAFYHVFRGRGRTEIADETLEWSEGDVFCIPPWAWHRHENLGHDEAILHSIDDWPTMAKMGFYRGEGEDA